MSRTIDPTSAQTDLPAMPHVPGFTHRFVDVPGLRTHVAEAGAGRPVVLLHGFPEHWWQWRTVGSSLAADNRVICPDLRGCGWSTATRRGIRTRAMVDDLIALLDTLGVDRALVVGHDLGAVVGAQAAYAHPSRVAALVALAVPPMFMPLDTRMLPGMRHIPRFLFHRRGTPIDGIFRPPWTVAPLDEAIVEVYMRVQRRPEIDAATAAIYRWLVLRAMPPMAVGAYRRRRLAVPALYAFGAHDAPLTEDFVRRACGDTTRYADHVEFASIADAAHFVTDEQPDAVAGLAREFFARVA